MQYPAELLQQWYHLALQYGHRHLTNARDRLPAISVIARIMAHRLDWVYVAGLWSHDLEAGLTWSTVQPEITLAINAARYTGPSWSWASAQIPITHYEPDDTTGERHPRSWMKGRDSLSKLGTSDWASYLEVLHFSVDLAGDDPYAEVKSGQLKILGNMRPIKSPKLPGKWYQTQPLVYSNGDTVDAIYRPDVTGLPAPAGTDMETWCLLAGFDVGDNGSPNCYALVVQLVSEAVKTFKRVGFMLFSRTVEDGEAWDKAIDWFLSAEPEKIYLV